MPSATLPNVLFIMADQHRADVMGVEGRADVPTPHLDGLTRQGSRCRRAYCNNAICGASRNSLQTGVYPRTLGIAAFEDIGYEGTLAPIQQTFKQAGYATGAFGKRHLKPRADTHWDRTATTLKARQETGDANWWDWINQRGLTEEAEADWQAEFGQGRAAPMAVQTSRLPDDATMEAWTADQTLAFMRDQRGSEQPFFAFCSFYRPHQPYTPTASWLDRIDTDRITLPPTLYESADALPPMLRHWRASERNPWCLGRAARDLTLYRRYLHAYLALVSEIDHHVGALLAELDALGITDDTIVVYTADHGDFLGAHGMIEKCALGHNVYEDTLRVPLIFRWPGRIRSQVSQDLIELVDLAPTLEGLCGLLPSRDDGRRGTPLRQGLDLSPMLTRGEAVPRPFAFSENGSQCTAISRDAKLGRWTEPLDPQRDYRAFGDQMFLRRADPFETFNALNDPLQQEPRAALEAALDRFIAQTPAEAWRAQANAQRRKE
jgi:arylsulfatase A-like enzyme